MTSNSEGYRQLTLKEGAIPFTLSDPGLGQKTHIISALIALSGSTRPPLILDEPPEGFERIEFRVAPIAVFVVPPEYEIDLPWLQRAVISLTHGEWSPLLDAAAMMSEDYSHRGTPLTAAQALGLIYTPLRVAAKAEPSFHQS